METVTIRVYYDFASTLCYVAHRVMCRIEREIGELGVELEWRPIDLTMAAPWDRGDSFRPDIRAAVRNTGLSLGIDVEMPDPWLDSRPASQVALCLRRPPTRRAGAARCSTPSSIARRRGSPPSSCAWRGI